MIDDEDDLYYEDYEEDEYEEAMMNCGQFPYGGIIHCSMIGSEECDMCPFYNDIGKKCIRSKS